MSEPVTVEGDNIMECEESEEEEDSAMEDLKSPCPIEPYHEEVKAREYLDTLEHGIKYESLRARKAGNMDCLQTSQRTVGDPELLLWLKKEPLHQQHRVDGLALHTLHLANVVQENQRRTFKKTKFQLKGPTRRTGRWREW